MEIIEHGPISLGVSLLSTIQKINQHECLKKQIPFISARIITVLFHLDCDSSPSQGSPNYGNRHGNDQEDEERSADEDIFKEMVMPPV